MILGRGRGQCLRDDSVRRFEFGERVLEERPLFFLPATRVPDKGIGTGHLAYEHQAGPTPARRGPDGTHAQPNGKPSQFQVTRCQENTQVPIDWQKAR